MGGEDEVSGNAIPLWSNRLIPASGGSNLGSCFLDVGQALLLCLEAGAGGQRRRKEDSQVAREGHLVPGTGAGNFWRELEPRPLGFQVWSAGGQLAGEGKKHTAHRPAGAAP